jgi:hypothetical protein
MPTDTPTPPERPGPPLPPVSGPYDEPPPGVPLADFAPTLPAKRCLGCYYVLDHLPTAQCPECGRAFDPDLPWTYATRPPFVRWRYWLPAAVLAVGLGLVAYLLVIPTTGFGWSATLAIPVMLGGVVGYGVRVGKMAAVVVAWLVLGICLLALVGGGFGGVFCTLILLAMAAVPLVVSVLAGVLLRWSLKGSRWDQRHYLPIVLLFLLPLGVAAVEHQLPPAGEVAVETVRVIDAPLPAAWDRVMFYEEVTHDPPWLLWVGLRRPLRTAGSTAHVGARKTCVYSRGHLTKQVTAREPPAAATAVAAAGTAAAGNSSASAAGRASLAFAVVEQDMFEDYSVRLTGGSFRFEAVDATHTRVTLTTRYRPLLHPRFAWGPVEAHVVHLLHGHVLEGMAREAARRAAVADGGAVVQVGVWRDGGAVLGTGTAR